MTWRGLVERERMNQADGQKREIKNTCIAERDWGGEMKIITRRCMPTILLFLFGQGQEGTQERGAKQGMSCVKIVQNYRCAKRSKEKKRFLALTNAAREMNKSGSELLSGNNVWKRGRHCASITPGILS
jgi:hypothetical protein